MCCIEYLNNMSTSIITVCKDREAMLKVSIHSWIAYKEITEIIVIDYCSRNKIKFLEEIDSRIKVIRINNKKFFNIGRAYNIGMQKATSDKILKLDVDYVLNPYYNLFKLGVIPSKNTFITGNFRDEPIKSPSTFLSHLNGFVFLHKNDFLKCKYSEFENYGWDDDDLYNCLQNNNLRRKYLSDFTDKILVYHNPHCDIFRVLNYKESDIKKSHKQNRNRGEIKRPLIDAMDEFGLYISRVIKKFRS